MAVGADAAASCGVLSATRDEPVMSVLFAISASHLLNDVIQALLPSIYPVLKSDLALSFAQVGLITLTFQLTASILQPFIGHHTDRRPRPYSLVAGMALTLAGLVLLSQAGRFAAILAAAGVIGLGSAVFHPEASRIARLASGGRHGFAQSLFQVGGNAGSALGPLLAAIIVAPRGQGSVLWFGTAALAGMVLLGFVGRWRHRAYPVNRRRDLSRAESGAQPGLRRGAVPALLVLLALMFSKFIYMACMTNFYTFFLMERFGVSVSGSQMSLFAFLFATAAGTMIGGPVGDRWGRKRVIWASIAGVAPFTLALPYVSLPWMIVLSMLTGVILSSAFSAILVYAQELMPGRVGLVSGLFFGLAFGLAGIGSAVLGEWADHTSIEFVFRVCAFLPLIGFLAVFLPDESRWR